MQAAQIPVSVWPFWYKNVRGNRGSYRPFLQQWREDEAFIRLWKNEEHDSLVFEDAAYTLFALARMASARPGEIWECGVYRGATAKLLAASRPTEEPGSSPHTIRLFDTFSGMPERRPETDSFEIGSLGDTSLESVKAKLASYEKIEFHPGFIPGTFSGLENSAISFAHIDVDQFETTKQCCKFIFPRLTIGGVMVIDDYGRPGTVGARIGADEFFSPLKIDPLSLQTGQAIIIK